MGTFKKDLSERKLCGTCAHFYQHYVLRRSSFTSVWCGHCTTPRLKSRIPDDTCPNWTTRDEEEPVSES